MRRLRGDMVLALECTIVLETYWTKGRNKLFSAPWGQGRQVMNSI